MFYWCCCTYTIVRCARGAETVHGVERQNAEPILLKRLLWGSATQVWLNITLYRLFTFYALHNSVHNSDLPFKINVYYLTLPISWPVFYLASPPFHSYFSLHLSSLKFHLTLFYIPVNINCGKAYFRLSSVSTVYCWNNFEYHKYFASFKRSVSDVPHAAVIT